MAYGTISNKGDATFDGTWQESGTGSGGDLSDLEERVKRLEEAMFPYKFTVSGSGVYKKGTTSSVTVRWSFVQGTTTATPDTLTINGESVAPSQTSKTYLDVGVDTDYVIKATKDGIEYTGTVTARFVNPSYFGVVPSNFVPTEELVKELSSGDIIKNTKTYTTPAFGMLTDIRDMSNQNLNGSYVYTEIAINDEMYYVYVLKTPSTVTNYKIIFN